MPMESRGDFCGAIAIRGRGDHFSMGRSRVVGIIGEYFLEHNSESFFDDDLVERRTGTMRFGTRNETDLVRICNFEERERFGTTRPMRNLSWINSNWKKSWGIFVRGRGEDLGFVRNI